MERTEPVGGEMADHGSTVTVYAYQYEAPANIDVPGNLVGMSEQEAREALAGAGFDPETISTETAPVPEDPVTTKDGDVVAVSPTGSVAPDTAIKLTLDSGKSKVPDLSGIAEARAVEMAKALGFETEIQLEDSTEQPAGVVISQDQDPGGELERGETIVIKVARAPGDEKQPPADPAPSETSTP